MSFVNGFEKRANSWKAPLAAFAIPTALGGGFGYLTKSHTYSDGKYRKATTGEKLRSAALEAASAGLMIGLPLAVGRAASDAGKRYSYDSRQEYSRRQYQSRGNYSGGSRQAPPPRSAGYNPKTHGSHLGFDVNPPKTKADAKRAYHQAAMKWHPDRPTGNAEKFKNVNNAWEAFNKGGHFEKLARAMYARIYG